MRWIAQLSLRLPPRCRRWRRRLPDEAGIGATPARRASLASESNRRASPHSAMMRAADSVPAARQLEQGWRLCRYQQRELALERCGRAGQLAHAAQFVATDPDPCALLAARQAAGDLVEPFGPVERPGGDLELGPELVQMPAQPALDPGALAHQLLAVINQQLDLQRCLIDGGHRQRVNPLTQRRPRDRHRVDRVRLAGAALSAAALAHQLRRDAHDALAALDQEALQRPRDMATVLDRPNPLAVKPLTPAQHGEMAGRAGRDRLAAPQLDRSRHKQPPRCALACVGPLRSRSCAPSLRWSSLTGGPLADKPHWGRCHAPIKSRRRSSGGGGRHNAMQARPTGRQAG